MAPAPAGRVRRTVVVLLVLGLVAVGGAGPAGAAGRHGRADDWDPRVADIAQQVERLRGLTFDHTVPVKVLDDAAFEKRFQSDATPTRKDRRAWDDSQAALIALGLLDEPVELETVVDALPSNVAGFYDPRRGAILVRGSRVDDPGIRTTLAHELTHALQDQHFGIAALQKRASRAGSGFTQALIEGDASDVEQRYYESLSARDQAAADETTGEHLATVTPLPPILEALLYAPYALGAESVGVLRAVLGRKGLDAVMRKPPNRDLGLVDPSALVDVPDWPDVDEPAVDSGDQTKGEPFPMEATGVYLVLAERLPWADALAVAERWGGDETVAFTRDGRPCVRMRVAGRDGAADAAAIGDAFTRWAASGGADTEVVPDGDQALVTLCDADATGAPAPTPPARAVVALAARNGFVSQLTEVGAPVDAAKCVADRLMALPEAADVLASVDTLNDEPPQEQTAAFGAAIGDNVARLQAECLGTG